MQVTKGTMTNTLGHLERAGHIVVMPDPTDRRSRRIDITDGGRRARDAAIAAIAPELLALAGALPPEAITAALPLLEDLRRLLNTWRNPGV